jgi:O-antigen/teichoic acid export membrane protein
MYKKWLSVIFGPVLLGLLAFITIRVYTELMTTEEFGIIMLYYGLLILLDNIFVASSSQGIAYYLKSNSKLKEQYALSKYLSTLFIKRYVYLFYMAIIFFCIISFIFKIDLFYWYFLFVSSLYVYSGIIKASIVVPYNVRQEQCKFSLLNILEASCVFITVCLALYFLGVSPSIFIGAILLSRIIFMFLVLSVRPSGSRQFNVEIDLSKTFESKGVFSYVTPIAFMGVLGWLGVFLDRYVLTLIEGVGVVGVYIACAGLMMRPYSMISSVLTNYYRPKMFLAESVNDTKQVSIIFSNWVLISIAMGIAGSTFIFLFGDALAFILLAEEFRYGAKSIMFALSIGLGSMLICHALDNKYFSKGNSRGLIIPQVLSIFFYAVCIYWLSVEMGVVGAALGRSAGDVIKLIITFFVCKKDLFK